MKPHNILQAFNGSQTGLDFQSFEAGTVADLSDGLAALAVQEGWAKPVSTPETRETKVVTPEETKPVEVAEKKKPFAKKK